MQKAIQQRETEQQHQKMLVKWFRIAYPAHLIFHVPNGGNRVLIEAVNLKRCGVVAAIPDLVIPSPRVRPLDVPASPKGCYWYNGLYIEMKKPKGHTPAGKLVPAQRIMLEYLNSQGYLAKCCWGFDEAKEVIQNYMKLEDSL